MGKKRKTYYLDETTIQKVKNYAHLQNMSENEAFENAVTVYEKFYQEADQYFPVPKEYRPILLEAIDNMIYQSRHILETNWHAGSEKEAIEASLTARIEHLLEIRKGFME